MYGSIQPHSCFAAVDKSLSGEMHQPRMTRSGTFDEDRVWECSLGMSPHRTAGAVETVLTCRFFRVPPLACAEPEVAQKEIPSADWRPRGEL